ncbi:cytochrome c [Paraferrimonas sedimenticola]|uniref:Cytochrome c n=2 Tax=Paraferrimonas sedimenticola TaxID=375674 RepID=A0AA37RX13_9GAMM|nr:cytochrome c [Paraferrimonas sedimenticola]
MLLLAALTLSISGCGRDGRDGTPGEPGLPGPPGPVTENISEAETLRASITEASVEEGKLSFTFSLTNANGVPVSGLEGLEDVYIFGVGVAKLTELQKRARPLPGHPVPSPSSDPEPAPQAKGFKAPQWTSYINRMVDPVDPPSTEGFPDGWDRNKGPQLQASIESSCKLECLTVVGDGVYQYTMQSALADYTDIAELDTSYNADLVHRVTLELKPNSSDPANTRLINTFYDFVPATGAAPDAADNRNLVALQESCIRCHSNDYDHPWAPKLIFHGGRRTEIENCVVCHTSYSGDPETGTTVDFGSMLHKIHRGTAFIVGFGGRGHDYSKVTFPAEYNACQACHIEGEGAPAQANYYNFHRQEACLSCHEPKPEDAPNWDGTARGLFHEPERFPNAWEQGCESCHAVDNQGLGATQFHMATQFARMQAKMKYAVTTRNATFVRANPDDQTGTLSFELKVSNPSDDSAYGSPVHEIAELHQVPVRAVGNGSMDYNFTPAAGDEDNKSSYAAQNNSFVGDLVALLKDSTQTDVTVQAGEEGYFVYTVTNVAMWHTNMGNLTAHIEVCSAKGGDPMACGTDPMMPPADVITKVQTPAIAFAVDPANAKVRRLAVANTKCAKCHEGQLNTSKTGIHKDIGREDNPACAVCHDREHLSGNFEDGSCVSCHNPTINNRHGFLRELSRSLDYKVLAHTLHSSRRSVENEDGDLVPAPITYPEHYANCLSCHEPGQLNLAEVAMQKAVVIDDGNGSAINISPTAAACAACHSGRGDSVKAHIVGNGGVWGPEEYVPGTESCATCHAEGRSYGVDVVHPVRDK